MLISALSGIPFHIRVKSKLKAHAYIDGVSYSALIKRCHTCESKSVPIQSFQMAPTVQTRRNNLLDQTCVYLPYKL